VSSDSQPSTGADPTTISTTVLIIGAGPAGLTAAAALASRLGPDSVLVVDRESTAGGIPRHSDHTGYGIRDQKRVMTGPAYARHLVRAAIAAGADIRTETMVTGWAAEKTVDVTSPTGRFRITADAIVLATGARERPRTARRIPGTRPHGVYTTGQLQNIVHLHHGRVGENAVVIGGELVSWSAVVTLREAGCKTVAMITRYPKAESYAVFTIPGRTVLRVPVQTSSRVTRILGKPRIEGIEIENLDSRERRIIGCDTAVFTGDWIPDHELARAAGIGLDPGTLGPLVDTALRTDRDGVFAAGNLLHPVDTADVAALDGRHVADQVLSYLRDRSGWPDGQAVRILVEPPLRWVAPGILRRGDPQPARSRLLTWTDEFKLRPTISVHQAGQEIAKKTLWWPAAPGRVFRIPAELVSAARPDAGPITIRVA
jgi:thioredoxin reductase